MSEPTEHLPTITPFIPISTICSTPAVLIDTSPNDKIYVLFYKLSACELDLPKNNFPIYVKYLSDPLTSDRCGSNSIFTGTSRNLPQGVYAQTEEDDEYRCGPRVAEHDS